MYYVILSALLLIACDSEARTHRHKQQSDTEYLPVFTNFYLGSDKNVNEATIARIDNLLNVHEIKSVKISCALNHDCGDLLRYFDEHKIKVNLNTGNKTEYTSIKTVYYQQNYEVYDYGPVNSFANNIPEPTDDYDESITNGYKKARKTIKERIRIY